MNANGGKLCGAKTRAGHPCGYRAGYKTDHVGFGRCHLHGGLSPSGRNAAAKEQAASEAARIGAEVPIGADEALEWTIRLLGGEVAFLQGKVAELEDGLLDGGDLHPIARALGSSAERLARVSKLGLDVDLGERRLQLDELIVAKLAEAVRGALAEVDLSAAQRGQLDAALRRHLAALNGVELRPTRELTP